MASEFRMQVSRVAFPLVIDGEDDAGNSMVLFEKRYSIDIGNKERIKEIYRACSELQKKSGDFAQDETAFDQIEELSKSIIVATIGDWEIIWEKANHNIFAVMALAFHITNTIKEESGSGLKRYGL
jgi:hypothetical protein